jgi:uncharacterized membrane protein YqhA
MKQPWRGLIPVVIAVCIAVIAAASWHSVEEIHYLKTFYPTQFTVEEAFYASGVELIKVILIGLPLLLVMGVGLYGLCNFKRDK